MKQMYFTIAGCNHYYGNDFMKKGMKSVDINEYNIPFVKEIALIHKVKDTRYCI